jgi:hypothetical protein
MKNIKLFEEFFHMDDEWGNKDINDLTWGPMFYNKKTEDLLTKFYFKYYNHRISVEDRFNQDISMIIEKISSDCKPFIQQFKSENCNKLIYRGAEISDAIKSPNFKDAINKSEHLNLYDLMIEKVVRKNRKPKDTPSDMSKIIDDTFFKTLGVRLRSQGVFGVSKISTTIHYGYPWIFIPVGNFESYWSPHIHDLWSWAEDQYNDYYQDFGEENGKFIGHDEYDAKSDAKFKEDMEAFSHTYKKGDLKGAISSGNEITFLCDNYLLVNSMYSDAILKWIKGEYEYKNGKLIY